MKFLLLSFLAGMTAALGFEPLGLWFLTFVGFAGLMWLTFNAATLRSVLARGWWFGVGHFTLGLNWIATAFTYQSAMPAWLGWIAVVLLSLYLAVYPATAAGLAWRYGRRDGMRFVLLFAAAWIVTEWLRATMFTGFAWNPAGVVLLPTGLARLAPWTGTYGLSGMVVLAGGCGLLVSTEPRRYRVIGLMLAIGVAALGGRFAHSDAAGAPGLPIRIVQPNIGQEDKWKPGFEQLNFGRLRRLSSPASTVLPGPAADGPRLLLWPEAAVTEPLQDQRRQPYYRRQAERLRETIASLLGPRDMLLTGGITLQSSDGVNVTGATNSVFAIDGRGRIVARYDKAHLVPYGDRKSVV